MRNVSNTRGVKRFAQNSPPGMVGITGDDVRGIVEDVVKHEFGSMLNQLKDSMITIVHKELAPLKKEIKDMVDSLTFMGDRFDEIEKEQLKARDSMKEIQEENIKLKTTITDLSDRMNYLEQRSRSSNLEIQCVPEKKQENLSTIIVQLGKVIDCQLDDKSILHCTRVAKQNTTSTRPRSIVVQLASPRIRDQFLASSITYNKANPQDKLNSTYVGLSDVKTPIYVTEHLSPANKALHAATRRTASEKQYKYVWVRNGKIFVRKSDDSKYILIKNKDSLNKM